MGTWIIAGAILYFVIMKLGKLQDGLDTRRGEMYEKGRRRSR